MEPARNHLTFSWFRLVYPQPPCKGGLLQDPPNTTLVGQLWATTRVVFGGGPRQGRAMGDLGTQFYFVLHGDEIEEQALDRLDLRDAAFEAVA